MPRVAPVVPDESDILCEGCGYMLNALPKTGNCPECGKAIAESMGAHRVAPAWEQRGGPRGTIGRFVQTTVGVIVRPKEFYRTLTTRSDIRPAKSFGIAHWILASVCLGTAAFVHGHWYSGLGPFVERWAVLLWLAMVAATVALIHLMTLLAARLTHLEATYRGIRLPLSVIMRGMYYHAAHYLPVSAMALATVLAYHWLFTRGWVGAESLVTYLYVLSAEVVLSAVYLFHTYWIAMKNMMYANR